MTTPDDTHPTATVVDLDARRPGWRPIIAFDRDSEDFTLGFETGLLYGRLAARIDSFSGTYHAANETMVRRVADALGYIVETKASDDRAWIFADFFRRAPR